jgi:hypothetical protein
MTNELRGRPAVQALLFAAGLVLTASNRVQAEPIGCPSATLSDYIALSASGGCSIAGSILSDFTLLPIPTGATQIPASQVTVSPFVDMSSPSTLDIFLGFGFAPSFIAGPGALLDVVFGYNVSTPAPVQFASLHLAGASATEDASVTALENVCLGSPFSTACPGIITSVFDSGLGLDDVDETIGLLLPGTLLGIVNDIGVGGGLIGSAALTGPVTNQFSTTAAPAAVPEPATAVLVFIGLCVLAARCEAMWHQPSAWFRRANLKVGTTPTHFHHSKP